MMKMMIFQKYIRLIMVLLLEIFQIQIKIIHIIYYHGYIIIIIILLIYA